MNTAFIFMINPVGIMSLWMICFAIMQIEVLDNFFCKMMLWTIVGIGNCFNLLYYESLQIRFLHLLQFSVGVSFLANLINCGSGKFVCKIYKLLLRPPFLHVVQLFGFGHLFFGTFADSRSGHIFANCRVALDNFLSVRHHFPIYSTPFPSLYDDHDDQ